MGFRTVSIFDISQTEGKELTHLTSDLKGDVKDFDAFVKSLRSVAPCPIEIKDINSNAKGYYDPSEHKIAVKKGLSELHTIKTMIHEITHSQLHSSKSKTYILEKKSKNTREVEAESVAYIVSNYYSLDTSDYSFSYLASWSSDKELTELKESLKTIRDHSSNLIDKIDKKFKELNIDKDKDKTKESIQERMNKAKKKSKNINQTINQKKSKSINKNKERG
jgi:hypothetical protein